MCNFARLSLGLVARGFRLRRGLLLELALRQQLAVLKRRRARPKLSPFDKLFWVLACRFWADWKRSLLVVTPETVVRSHRAGFRLYWSLISKVKKQVGRKKTVDASARADLSYGGGKPNLGRSSHSR